MKNVFQVASSIQYVWIQVLKSGIHFQERKCSNLKRKTRFFITLRRLQMVTKIVQKWKIIVIHSACVALDDAVRLNQHLYVSRWDTELKTKATGDYIKQTATDHENKCERCTSVWFDGFCSMNFASRMGEKKTRIIN